MKLLPEDAMRIAILSHPEAFGLTQTDVNPLLLYTLRMAEGDAGDVSETTAQECFELCQATLHNKVVELLSDVCLAGSSGTEPQPEAVPAAAVEKPSNGHHAGVVAVRTDKLTTKQLRKIGYLLHQLGETPDYKQIANLSTTQATMRIKELEKRLEDKKGRQ